MAFGSWSQNCCLGPTKIWGHDSVAIRIPKGCQKVCLSTQTKNKTLPCHLVFSERSILVGSLPPISRAWSLESSWWSYSPEVVAKPCERPMFDAWTHGNPTVKSRPLFDPAWSPMDSSRWEQGDKKLSTIKANSSKTTWDVMKGGQKTREGQGLVPEKCWGKKTRMPFSFT